jgi:hypothetical protein
VTDPTRDQEPTFDLPGIPTIPSISEPSGTTLVVPKKPEHLATQVVYPWRSALRAGGATFVGFLLAVAAITADPVFDAFVGKYVPGGGGGVVAFGVFCGALAGLINRLANLKKVSTFLTAIHLGPIPKH